MAISDELRHLESFLCDEFEKGHKVSDLYELVQYAGNIIPRLYLLVLVGTVYIKAKQIPTKDILKDLVEMCRGVQHPLRGLFLRNYLLQSIKRDLPEETIETKHGSVEDSIDFILLNFSEMNKLWVRMQHQGHSRNKAQREQERRELRILVGTNLVRLSSLEGVQTLTYEKKILPAIMEQIVSCKDAIAQEYLMECIIQVFPDEFHLKTLRDFLHACGRMHPKVDVKNIIIALIDRLAQFALRDDAVIPEDMNLFEIFFGQVKQVLAARPEMASEDVISLQVSVAHLALKCYPDNYDYMNRVLEFTTESLKSRGETKLGYMSPASKELQKLLKIPIEGYGDIALALELEHFVGLFDLFDYDLRKELALFALERVIDAAMPLSAVAHVETFLTMISPLVKDQPDQPADEDEEDFDSDQTKVGQFLSLLHSGTPDVQYQMISMLKKQLSAGGVERIKYTMPPLVFQAFKLARRYKKVADEDANWQKKVKKIFTFCHQIITGLVKAEFTDLAFRLFLQAALTANAVQFDATENIAYEFMSQAFTLYEEEVAESNAQIAAITLLVGTMEQMSCFSEENYTPLATKCAIMSSKLLKKPDQARGVCLCTHVFWSSITLESDGEQRDGKQVKKCLSKAQKVAKSCIEPAVQAAIFVEILNRCMLYYEWGSEEVTVEVLSELAGAVAEALDGLDGGEADEGGTKEHFGNTLAHIKHKMSEGGDRSYAGFVEPSSA